MNVFFNIVLYYAVSERSQRNFPTMHALARNCLSVRLLQIDDCLEDCCRNLRRTTVSKICSQFRLQSDNNTGHSTWRPAHASRMELAECLSERKMFRTEFIKKNGMRSLCPYFFTKTLKFSRKIKQKKTERVRMVTLCMYSSYLTGTCGRQHKNQ